MNGILNINKGAGWTSFDVVARLRSLLKQKKIGHTGTLDPQATGVLPVCLGKATKVCSLLTDWDKTYEAVLRPGVVTDTQDMTGEVLGRQEVNVTFEQIKEAILSFVGEYDQIPPMYSAKKQDGKRLYDLARQGISVEREPVRVSIRAIEDIESLENGGIRFSVTCSKGTYIRTLCSDIGEKLGCGGCMESLVRTAVGPFSLRDARTIQETERDIAEGRLRLMSIDSLFTSLPAFRVRPGYMKALENGNLIPAEGFEAAVDIEKGIEGYTGRELRVYTAQGDFAAIYEEKGGVCRPRQMFWP